MKQLKMLPIAIFVIVTMISSCAKEQGCTDKTAKNFNAEAEEDDGSCTYPTTAEKLEGTWNGTYIYNRSDQDAPIVLAISFTFYNNGTGTISLLGETGDLFLWTANNDNVSIIADGETTAFNILTNTSTTQEWISSSRTTAQDSTYTEVITISLTKS